MLVSASFLSSKDIPKFLTKLNDTDINYIHVDVMDGVYVKNKTMPFREMKHISDYTSKRLDVHLMVKNPLKYIDDYASLNTEYITILKNSLTFLSNDITGQDIESSFSDYLNLKAQEIVPYCWEVSYDFGNIENRITEKIYDDISSNGQYLRDYLNTINAPVYNLSIIQSQAPNFKDASRLLEKGV